MLNLSFFMLKVGIKIQKLKDFPPSRNVLPITAFSKCYGTHFCYIRLQPLNQTHHTDGKGCPNSGADKYISWGQTLLATRARKFVGQLTTQQTERTKQSAKSPAKALGRSGQEEKALNTELEGADGYKFRLTSLTGAKIPTINISVKDCQVLYLIFGVFTQFGFKRLYQAQPEPNAFILPKLKETLQHSIELESLSSQIKPIPKTSDSFEHTDKPRNGPILQSGAVFHAPSVTRLPHILYCLQ